MLYNLWGKFKLANLCYIFQHTGLRNTIAEQNRHFPLTGGTAPATV